MMGTVIVAGAFIGFLGSAFVITAAITVLLRFGDTRLRRRLATAPRLTCAEVRSAGKLPAEVLITGRTAAGRDGELRSPAYNTACIWYETSVSSGDSLEDTTTYLRLTAGDEAIRIDDGTGSVLLEPALVQQVGTGERLPRVRNESIPVARTGPVSAGTGLDRLDGSGLLPAAARPRLGRRQLDLSEQTVAAGLQVSVLARPRRTAHDEWVLLCRKGVVTTGDPESWVAKLEADDVTTRWMILIFPLIGAGLIVVGGGLMWLGVS